MKFESQICTTKEQSERLLALGLKKETADMYYLNYGPIGLIPQIRDIKSILEDEDIPAWSLHRLITMLTYQVIHKGDKYEPVIDITGMAYQGVCTQDSECGWTGDMYTDVIDCLEWVIKIGQFNQDYLDE